jgi:Ca2+-binding EF-hand superfamily protein
MGTGDVDGSGSLTMDEFTKAITAVIPDLTAADCLRIFESIDVNSDGQVFFCAQAVL